MCAARHTCLARMINAPRIGARVRAELGPAVLGTEVDGLFCVLDGERLPAVHMHAADWIARAAPNGQIHERGEHDHGDHVEEELVVERNRAKDVAAAWTRRL